MADFKKAAQSLRKATKDAVETTRGAVETAKAVASKMADVKAGRDEASLRRRFQKATRRPGNAPEDLEIHKVGAKAWKWPKLNGEWLDAFPDFPYHIDGLRCLKANDVWISYIVYLGPKDRGPLQSLVDLANDRLVEANQRWRYFPVFRHAVPELRLSPRDVVTWPPNYAKLTARPFTGKNRKVRDLPFGMSMSVPYWRPDGFFDVVSMECDLDASGSPHRISSRYKPYYEGDEGLDYVEFTSCLTDDGWEFVDVETQETELTGRSRSWL